MNKESVGPASPKDESNGRIRKERKKLEQTPSSEHERSLVTREEAGGFHCEGSGRYCCASWDGANTDDWWTQHPEWELGPENATHTCFRRIEDPGRVAFLRELHDLQWRSDCSRALQREQISSGYAAALTATARSFYDAHKRGRPFQRTRHREGARWNFGPGGSDAGHWAHCPTRDMECYFLPISRCPAEIGRDDAARGARPSAAADAERFLWLRRYAFRPRHGTRRHLREFMHRNGLPTDGMGAPCAAVHVRRTDVAFGRGRRYAAVHEYLEAGKISKGETVVLLTDDASTIDEVERFHKNDYNWIVLDRPRFRGSEGGFEGFIPSRDPTLEVLSIMAEIKLAGQCNKLVHGKSGFVALITEEMAARGHPFETVYLQTQQDKREQAKIKPDERAESYLAKIEKELAKHTRDG
jgi:hypothetical protein